jgi:flagellar hook assembly protein FlgD
LHQCLLKLLKETYCYPNPFSPRQEFLKIKYSTGSENRKVTIRVLDFSMNIVKTVIQNADRTRTLDDAPDRWDGRDENGNLVPNGVYFYRIDFDNENPVFGKIIVLQ